MNVNDVRAKLAEIRRFAEKGIDEAAHDAQDTLFESVLREIGTGGVDSLGDACQLCAVALEALDIEFNRWYA